MESKQFNPTDLFDAQVWDGVYTERRGSGFVFRRSSALAQEVVLRISRPGQVWLDIGCGTGYLASALSRAGRRMIGLDHDPAMLDCATRRHLSDGPADGLQFVRSDACRLPFEDGYADGAVAVSLTGCLADPEAFYREVCRVLRPGGYAVLTFTHRASWLLKINALIRRLSPVSGQPEETFAPVRLYRRGRTVEQLRQSGLEPIAVRYYNFVLNRGDRLLPPERTAGRLDGMDRFPIARRLGRNFIITAQKRQAPPGRGI